MYAWTHILLGNEMFQQKKMLFPFVLVSAGALMSIALVAEFLHEEVLKTEEKEGRKGLEHQNSEALTH